MTVTSESSFEVQPGNKNYKRLANLILPVVAPIPSDLCRQVVLQAEEAAGAGAADGQGLGGADTQGLRSNVPLLVR
jgi:hypothetical protein